MRDRLTWKDAASLSIGDRDLPLEMDLQADIVRQHAMIGRIVEVSPIAGGDLQERRGKSGKVTGVYLRFGQTVGYEVEIEGHSCLGTGKDLFLDRAVLEDIQPPTASSASIREVLSKWDGQRTYWISRIDGLESMCFELASVTPMVTTECFPWGWRFLIPDLMPGERTVVDCRAIQHGNFWSVSTTVYPERSASQEPGRFIPDHWARVFSWTHSVTAGMMSEGFTQWKGALLGLETRARASVFTLRPLVESTLASVLEAKKKLKGSAPEFAPGSICAAFSDVRLKAATVGLTEPPTDRRAYTIISVSPTAVKKPGYLQQVVLHECLHIAVGSTGGEPHNDEFTALAEMTGLAKENRD